MTARRKWQSISISTDIFLPTTLRKKKRNLWAGNTDADQLTAISVYDDGTGMAFAFSPASAEGMDMLASIMMASLLTYDEAVEVVAQQ